jgi:hypothetical protein
MNKKNLLCFALVLLFGAKLQAATTVESSVITASAYFSFPPNVFPVDQPVPGLITIIKNGPTVSVYLYYSFCINPDNTADSTVTVPCLEGYGYIPNSSVTGTVGTSFTAANVFSVSVDTSTVSGFENYVCLAVDSDGNCTDLSPAAGGLVEVTFEKTPVTATITSYENVSGASGTITSNKSIDDTFSCQEYGTVLGGSFTVTQNVDTALTSQFLSLQKTTETTTTTTAAALIKPPSEVAKGWMPENVIKKMRAIELKAGLGK